MEGLEITYSSDYFEELFRLAVRLVERGLAYVFHCTGTFFLIELGRIWGNCILIFLSYT